MLTIDRAGAVIDRRVPGSRRTIRPVTTMTSNGASSGGAPAPREPGSFDGANATMTPSVGWKMVSAGQGQALLLHQRGLADEVSETQGGYSGMVLSSIRAVRRLTSPRAVLQ